MDLMISFGLVVFVFSWLFPIIGVLIKLTSKGPLIFKQLRHGKDNIPFYCYKFRTMYVNDQADTVQATKNDPRITPIGKILRKTSLDELPQFFNVIKGDMSIVGPRPHAVPMNYKFSAEIDNFMFRHTVKPGITGLAQAKGFRGETRDFYDIYSRCKLDIFYVNNWSPLLDLKIIFWTILSLLLHKDQAY
ncbi:sugar transferase [Cyclobacterium xiamenense]|uniref:sugar transferase n=1 Tax=Cyclobacterium xiamenense TaxID=1297121 RepID=UPI0035CF9275